MEKYPLLFDDGLTRLFARYAEWRIPRDQAKVDESQPGPVADDVTTWEWP